MKKKPTEKEINIIAGKMLVGHASVQELHTYLHYCATLEGLVEEASMEDFYGTEGWRKKVFRED